MNSPTNQNGIPLVLTHRHVPKCALSPLQIPRLERFLQLPAPRGAQESGALRLLRNENRRENGGRRRFERKKKGGCFSVEWWLLVSLEW